MKYFGTDGIRGEVGSAPLTADFMVKLGWAIGVMLKKKGGKDVVLGKDTRCSGYMIESALQAGLSASGMNVYLLGPLPSAAISFATTFMGMDLGIIISASHNPYHDNGIKLINSHGMKVSEQDQRDIEDILAGEIVTEHTDKLGKAFRADAILDEYVKFCTQIISEFGVLGGKVIVDCANGAAYKVAPRILATCCSDLEVIHASPDGYNINKKCGTEHPTVIQQAVLDSSAQLGIAFDGDSDRVILVDHHGDILDGDELLFVIAKGLVELEGYQDGVVGTVMSNAGLEVALQNIGLSFMRASVGEQHVIKAMLESSWRLGGEPSGHIICHPMSQTDDGIVTALLVIKLMLQTGKSLYELKQGICKFPQLIKNVPNRYGRVNLECEEVLSAVQCGQKRLGKMGRVLLRHSGTQPVIRIMIEGESEEIVEEVMEHMYQFVAGLVTDGETNKQ